MLPTRKSVPRSAGNRTTRRPPDHRKETQTAVVWSRLPFIRSGQNHLARHSERGKKPRQTEEEVGRQHQGMDRPGVRQVQEGSGEQGKLGKLVAKSFMVPKRPSRLRDRWDEMKELLNKHRILTRTYSYNHTNKLTTHTHTHTHTRARARTHTHN